MMNKKMSEQQKQAVENYPENYYHNSNGYQLNNESIKELIKMAVGVLNNNPETNETHAASGNTIVIASRVHPEDGGGIHIVVAENYKEFYVDNVVFNN